MAEAIPYWHVDAFAERPFTGNQAAVLLFEQWPAEATMQAIAAENMFAETAFLVPERDGGDAAWALRWFTPAQEIRLCGHATLASGHVLLGRDGSERVRFRTREAGLLEVRRSADGYELALPVIAAERVAGHDGLVALGGAAPRELWSSRQGYHVFLYASPDEVEGLTPDFPRLAGFGDDLFICTAPGTGHSSGADVVSRVFAPGAGIDEDSVTGAAHAVLTPLWTGWLGRGSFTAFQASARTGRLTCRQEGDRAWLGGGCVTVVEGRFLLERAR